MTEQDLFPETNSFWDLFKVGDFEGIHNMLAHNCRIQDGFGEDARGVNGIENCIEKLSDIYGKMAKAVEVRKVALQNLTLMRSRTQTRFKIMAKVVFLTIALSFALEWKSGVIVCIVVTKNAADDVFFLDNTPEYVESVCDNESRNSIEVKAVEEPNEETVTAFSHSDTPLEDDAEDIVSAPIEKKKWFPGKLVGEISTKIRTRRASMKLNNKEVPAPARALKEYSDRSDLTQLKPPFLVSQPEASLPCVIVTVESCRNLRSSLQRVITRPINSFVTVSLDKESAQTPVVPNEINPVYPNHRFSFDFTPDRRDDEYILFTVKDKHINEDFLGEVRVPVISLKTSVNDTDAPTILTLQLDIHTELLGKRFGKGVLLKKSDKSDTASITVRLTKVDPLQWWVLEEQKMRDAEKEREYLLRREARRKERQEQKEKAKLERENQKQRDKDALDEELEKFRAESTVSVFNIFEERVIPIAHKKAKSWIPDDEADSCASCGTEFSFMTWKHHCRICGNIFCSNCTNYKVLIEDREEISCTLCWVAAKWTNEHQDDVHPDVFEEEPAENGEDDTDSDDSDEE